MKNILILLLAASFVISCASEAEKAAAEKKEKEEELAEMRKEAAELQTKISKLDQEINPVDSADLAKKQVAVTVMQPQPFEHYIEVQARVDGDENVAVAPEAPGTVMRINVEPGDKVSKGTILAELDAAATQKQVELAQNQVDFLNTLFQKQKSLWDQKVGSEVQYLTAKNNYESAVKNLATLREQLSMSKIKSPISGTVDAVDIKVGQTIMAGMPSIRVVNMSNLKVKAEVAEAFVSKVKTGNEVKIVFPDINHEVRTKLTYSGKVIDNLNRTFNVEAALSPKEANLHPNMVAILKIVDYKAPSAFSVPVNLIQTNGSESYLFVLEPKGKTFVAKKKVVKTGQSYNGTIEIKEGLKQGDKVITTGYQDLLDNDDVKL
jgi:membrane fusion protein, multidrug efflux system